MATLSFIKDFVAFMKKWLGKRTNPDGVAYYQCVDLILQRILDAGHSIVGIYGNAIDYANRPTANFKKLYSFKSGNMTGKDYVVVLKGTNGNVFGHICLGLGENNAKQFNALEQNGATGSGSGAGGNAIRTRWIDRSRIVAMWAPKVSVAPPPKPPAPKPPAPNNPFTYVVKRDVQAYYNSLDAKNRQHKVGVVRKRAYAIFNKANGMINVTTSVHVPGSWINPADNK